MGAREQLTTLLLASALVACGKGPCPLDDSLTASECRLLHAMVLPEQLPAARGNRYGDDSRAAFLGWQVFFDARFSGSSEMRCATCHQPERRFQDFLPRPAVGQVFRKTQGMLNVARLRLMFWDGRADSIWSQALTPLESRAEMNYSRLEIAHQLAASWGPEYERVFGPLPPLGDTARFPRAGKPGDAAWQGMAVADRDAIDRVVANLGKAFEAYERKLSAGRAPFDHFVLGDPAALSAKQRDGLRVFLRSGCIDCHSGPLFTDQGFHNLGIPAAPGVSPDPGRASAFAGLQESPFSLRGPFSDDPSAANADDYVSRDGDLGSFRTPSLRNVTLAAPYGHNGSFATLPTVIDFHLSGGGASGGTSWGAFVGTVDAKLVPRRLSTEERAALVDFLGALEGQYPPLPWNNWPQN